MKPEDKQHVLRIGYDDETKLDDLDELITILKTRKILLESKIPRRPNQGWMFGR